MSPSQWIQLFSFFFLAYLPPFGAVAQPVDTTGLTAGIDSPTLFRHLSQETVLPVRLKVDVREMYRQKIRLPDYLPAELNCRSDAGPETTWEIKIKARGNSRRQICAYPPLKLKFPKKLLREAGLATDHNKLKLVTHCKSGGTGSQYVLREYLAYRIYNELTDSSFRVQLVQVEYEDSRGKRKTTTEYGILIEDVDELAARVGGKECADCAFTNHARFEHDSYLLFCVFQYLIGNTDFSIKDLHNLKVLESEDSFLPVPYDFDYAGLVNASYAIPHERIPIEHITERYYMGLRFPCDAFDPILRRVREKREKIFSLVAELEPLDKQTRAEVNRYLLDFFDVLEGRSATVRAFDCVEEGR